MELNKIYLGDAYELIKQLPDKSIDLVYTDIPYSSGTMGKDSWKGGDNGFQYVVDKTDPFFHGCDMSIFPEMIRVLKKTNIYVWCSFQQVPEIIAACEGAKRGLSYKMLVWHKTNAATMNYGQFLSDLEYCLVVTEGQGLPNANRLRMSRLYQSPMNSADRKLYMHPTIKPLRMVVQHIDASTNEGDVILDPFMGSGTTAEAVIVAGKNRKYIGFEIDEKWKIVADNRAKGITAKEAASPYFQERLF